MLERLRPLVGARDARVGRLRFFLLIASTSFWSATICDTRTSVFNTQAGRRRRRFRERQAVSGKIERNAEAGAESRVG